MYTVGEKPRSFITPGLIFLPKAMVTKEDESMWGLLLSTILTSAADSVNPIAITQQFILQGLVKKPKHIWYFILPTGITNLIGGFLAYFGLVAFVGSFFQRIVESYGFYLFAAELIVGIALLIAGSFVIQNRKISALKKQIQSTDKNEESEEEKDRKQAIGKVKSVSPLALIGSGLHNFRTDYCLAVLCVFSDFAELSADTVAGYADSACLQHHIYTASDYFVFCIYQGEE